MNCDQARRLIDAYLDSEVSPAQKAEIQIHVATCNRCAVLLKMRQTLSQAIKDSATYVPAPASLGAQFRSESRFVRGRRVSPLSVGLAFGVGMALALAGLMIWRPWTSPVDRVIDDLLADQTRATISNHLVDIKSSDRKVLLPWFASKAASIAPHIPEMQSEGISLLGGRLGMIDGQPVVVEVFQYQNHPIHLFVMPTQMSTTRNVDRNGFHILSWSSCGLNYWAISDINITKLDSIRMKLMPERQ